jgi:hypothetical protein
MQNSPPAAPLELLLDFFPAAEYKLAYIGSLAGTARELKG